MAKGDGQRAPPEPLTLAQEPVNCAPPPSRDVVTLYSGERLDLENLQTGSQLEGSDFLSRDKALHIFMWRTETIETKIITPPIHTEYLAEP